MERSITPRLLSLSLLVTSWAVRLMAAPHFPSNEDLRQLRSIANPRLSPDGKHVVVELEDSTEAGGRTHLWLLNSDGSSYRQLTFADPNSTGEKNPQFLPDGNTIIFISGSKLCRLSLVEGRWAPISLMKNVASDGAEASVDVDSYSVAPDGRTIAVVATDPEPSERSHELTDRRDVVWVDHDDPQSHVYLVNTATWEMTEVPRLADVDDVVWSPQSDRLLVLTHTRPADFGFSTAAWIVAAQNPASQERISGIPESTHRAVWLHSGKGFVLFAQCEQDAPWGSSDLYVFDLSSGKLKHLSAGVKDSTLSSRTLIVASDDRRAIVSLTRGVRRGVGRVDLSSGSLQLLDLGMPVIADFTQQGNAWVYIASSSVSAPSVYMTTTLESGGKRLVQPEVMPKDWRSVESITVSWRRAGLTLEGLVYLPPEASTHRVPLVVIAHGGPPGQFTDTYLPLTNLLVGQGWAVFLPNPRGSTGYGVAFEASNKGDLGNGDFLDIMAGVEEVLRTQPIDPSRTAFVGHSYGGTMAAFVEGKTARFKAIVSSAPVTDQVSEQGTEDDPYPDSWFTGLPWQNRESAWRQSPVAYASQARTPFLLLHGQEDKSDPPGQSMELYHALRLERVPVQLLLFPRETHGSMGRNFYGQPSMEPWHGVIARERMIGFITDAFTGKLTPRGK